MALTISLARRYVAEHQVQGSISSRSVTVATGIGLGYPLTGIIAVIPSGPDERAPKTPFDSKGATLLGLGGSSFGTAISGAVIATHAGSDHHATGTGINLSFEIGTALCLVVLVSLLVNAGVKRSHRANVKRAG